MDQVCLLCQFLLYLALVSISAYEEADKEDEEGSSQDKWHERDDNAQDKCLDIVEWKKERVREREK